MALLAGELGGYLGLLLGASVVTVFELLDFVIYNSARRCDRSKAAAKSTDAASDVDKSDKPVKA